MVHSYSIRRTDGRAVCVRPEVDNVAGGRNLQAHVMSITDEHEYVVAFRDSRNFCCCSKW